MGLGRGQPDAVVGLRLRRSPSAICFDRASGLVGGSGESFNRASFGHDILVSSYLREIRHLLYTAPYFVHRSRTP
eukprot:4317759-Prymnesium_polylepis.1